MPKITGKLTIAIFFLSALICSQTIDPSISELVDQVSTESLIGHVRILSGADSIRIDRIWTSIKTRQVRQPDHDKARTYLKTTLEEYGYVPEEVCFNWYDTDVCNLLVTKPGNRYPNQKYILCAHYDSYNPTESKPAPGADDNASGVAAVLESARILQNIKTDYTIVFALWDAEENGRWGSEHFAFNAARDNDTILGVINLDMIAYDPAKRQLFSINAEDSGSLALSETLVNLTRDYSDSLQPVIYNPGSMLSDHQKFWQFGFSAVLISEAYRDGADYPYYHTALDTDDKINSNYLHKMSKLALAAIATLANVSTSDIIVESPGEAERFLLAQNYPNPCNATTTIRYAILQAGDIKLTLYNLLGQELAVLIQKMQPAGTHEVRLNLTDLRTGLYIYRLHQGKNSLTRPMLLLK